MSSMTTRFIVRIQRNLDSWRAGEIDFAIYNDCQRQTWAAIHAAGPDVEAAVVTALTGPALLAEVGLLDDDETRTVQLRVARDPAPRSDVLRYRGEICRTPAGSPVLRIAPADPGSPDAEHRQVAAMVYELAADMERRSQQLEAHWSIAPAALDHQIVIELSGDHEAELADELLTTIMSRYQLLPDAQSSGNPRATRVRRNGRTV